MTTHYVPNIPPMADTFFGGWWPGDDSIDPGALLADIAQHIEVLDDLVTAWLDKDPSASRDDGVARRIEVRAKRLHYDRCRFMYAWRPGWKVPAWAVECRGARPDGSDGPHLRPLRDAGFDLRPEIRFEDAVPRSMRDISKTPELQDHEEMTSTMSDPTPIIMAGRRSSERCRNCGSEEGGECPSCGGGDPSDFYWQPPRRPWPSS